MKPYPGLFYTGDGAARDGDGYIWIKGRVDGERRTLTPHLVSVLTWCRRYQCLWTSSVDRRDRVCTHLAPWCRRDRSRWLCR